MGGFGVEHGSYRSDQRFWLGSLPAGDFPAGWQLRWQWVGIPEYQNLFSIKESEEGKERKGKVRKGKET